MEKIVSLRELCTMEITDGTHKTPVYSDTGFIFLSSKNVTSESIDWNNVMYIPKQLHNELYKRIAPQRDDILLAKNGTTGIAALVDKDEIFDIYVSLALIRPDQEKVIPKYLLYAINCPASRRFFDSHLKGIGVPNLHLTHIRETPIKVYAIADQCHIVEVLDKVSDLISLRKQQLAKLDELVKARFVEMFGACAEFKRLEEYATLITKGASPKWQGVDYCDEGVLFVTSENVREGYLDLSKRKYLDAKINEIQPRSILKKNDILINIVGASIGRAAIYNCDEIANINQAVALVRADYSQINQTYLMTYLNSTQALEMYGKMKKGGARDNLSLQNIADLQIPVASMELQQQFATFVKQTDKSKLAVQQSLDKMETLKNSLLQKFFG